ncbi:MAG: T9SS type A sorting domain-containing protein [Bacteroidia bacterium]|nr:T9SS type A sorting domain-containing protein [Bacteroidia bacterium]
MFTQSLFADGKTVMNDDPILSPLSDSLDLQVDVELLEYILNPLFLADLNDMNLDLSESSQSLLRLDLSNAKVNFASVLNDDLLFTNKDLSVHKIYPNPASSVAFLDYRMIEDVQAKLTIRNLLGRVVKEYNLSKGERRIRIPTVDFDSGVYFYILSINGKAEKGKKLIVNHN